MNEQEACWHYHGICLYEPPDGYYGFIYKITDDKGRIYYGKKAFTHSKKTTLSKKARVGTRKRVQRINVDSKWLSYWGSCRPLLEYIKTQGTKGFYREIIKLCEDKTSLAYWEMDILCQEKVLFRDDCWNANILCKFYKGKVK